MADPSATTAGSDAGDPPTIAALRSQVHERDRRLAELTEHSLRILDELARVRAESGDREALRRQNARLEELLADTRARVRNAANVVLSGPLPATPCAVVAWGVDGLDPRRLQRQIESCGDVPVTVLAGEHAATVASGLPAMPALAVLDTPCPTPAVAWNLGMAATQAEVVVFLWGGARLPDDALARLAAAAAAEGIAAVTPVVHAGKQRWLGAAVADHLQAEALSVPRGRTPVSEVPLPLPEAFAIARRAFAAVGAFDQDLATEVALTEWMLRARLLGHKTIGLRDVVADVPGTLRAALAAGDPGDRQHDGDRMIALARHRPKALAAAMLACASVWQQPPDRLGAWFGALLRRLPAGDPDGIASDLLVQQVTALAGHAVSVAELSRQREQLERVFGATLGPDAGGGEASLQRVVEQVQRLRREGEVGRETAVRLQQQLGEREQTIGALQGSLDALRAEIGRCQEAIREQKDEIIRRDGAVSGLKDELRQRDAAILALKEDALARQREIAEATRAIAVRDTELGHARAQLLAAQRDAQQTDEALQRLRSHAADLEQAATRGEVARADLAARLATAEQRAAGYERELAAESGRLEAATRELSNCRTALDAALEAARGEREQLTARVQELEQQGRLLDARVGETLGLLQQREQWIAALLDEVGRRRWRPRALLEHERRFLDERRR